MSTAEAALSEAAAELRAIRKLLEAFHLPAPALIERKAFAALLSVGETTLDTLRAAGKVGPAEVKVGGGIRWNRDEVEAWLATPTPAGELHTAQTWPAVWADLRRRRNGTGGRTGLPPTAERR
jgi:predicted DNA-binding transcriptional regulator AlpA